MNWLHRILPATGAHLSNVWVCYIEDDIPIVKKFTRALRNEGIRVKINPPIDPLVKEGAAEHFQSIAAADIFVVVTSEYNLGYSSFKNYIQYAKDNKKEIFYIDTGDGAFPTYNSDERPAVLHFVKNTFSKADMTMFAQKTDLLNTFDVFISYSREDKSFATELYHLLKDKRKKTWIDLQNISYSEAWWKAIESAIASAENFVFILSPSSITSTYCTKELLLAIEYNKRIIPILHKPVNETEVEQTVRDIHWLPILSAEATDEGVTQLIETIESDPNYKKAHTQYIIRANEWLNNGKNSKYLLEARQLRAAEEWRKKARTQSLAPAFTAIQLAYLKQSRRRRTFRYAITGAMYLLASLIITIVYNQVFVSVPEYETYNLYNDIPVYILFFSLCTLGWYIFFFTLQRREGYAFNRFTARLPLLFAHLALLFSLLVVAKKISLYEDYSNLVVALGIVTAALLAYTLFFRMMNHVQKRAMLTALVALVVITAFGAGVFGIRSIKSDALYKAIRNHDIPLVKKYTADTSQLHSTDVLDVLTHKFSSFINDPVHLSAPDKSAAVILLQRGIGLQTYNSEGGTVAHWIVATGDTALLTLAFQEGLNINATDDRDKSLLMIAVEYNKLPMANYLIEKKANLDYQMPDGTTALLMATQKNVFDTFYGDDSVKRELIIKSLVNHKAAINLADTAGNTPLIKAIQDFDTAIVRFLLKSGADVNQTNHHGETPLYIAAKSKPEMLPVLLENGAGAVLTRLSDRGLTPWMYAAMNEETESMAILEKNGSTEATSLAMATESGINEYGYYLLGEDQLQKAIQIFTLNTKRYPQSTNAWDSLGEAYYKNNETKPAILCFKRVLQMHPSSKLKDRAEMYLGQLALK